MLTNIPENTAQKQSSIRPFQPGRSGNPSGRPRGSRNKTTCAVEALFAGEAAAITRKAIQLALAGDPVALKMCLDRIAPCPKGRPISISVEPLATLAELPGALAAVANKMLAGGLSPVEADRVTLVLERLGVAYERGELTRRIEALESRSGGSR